jgi:hypothetical protein
VNLLAVVEQETAEQPLVLLETPEQPSVLETEAMITVGELDESNSLNQKEVEQLSVETADQPRLCRGEAISVEIPGLHVSVPA